MERMTEKQVAKNTIEKLAIVVVTYRRQQLLATLFESIEKLTVAPWRIIVVDNEHSEATQGMVDDFREAVTAQWGNTIADQSGNESRVVYAPQSDNLGGAGGFSAGVKKAYELGAYINLDDATMVDFLDRVAGIPENIFCRYNPGGTFQLGESEEGFQVMDKPGDAKYGMTEEQMIDSYKKLMAKGAKNFGIHAFLASNTISDAYYPELAGILFQLAVRVQKATGAHIGYINLSGGVGIPYRPEQTENDILAIGEGVRKKFEEILVPAGMGDVAIFTEMGRFTTGPYGALVATAIHEKHIYKEYIGLDACAANLMRPAMYGAYHHITVLGKEDAPCDHMYDVVGGLCENNDKFAIDRMLPKIDIGDVLYIHDTGAHGSAMGYNYNGKLRSAEVLLCEDGSHRLIRRAETPRDYFATLDFLPLMKPLFED